MAVNMEGRSIGQALTTNLQKVQDGKAYAVDREGKLVGEALKASFKGKLVETLVNRGIAREGSIGGRIAVALVGKEDFQLIASSRRANVRSSVSNTLHVLESWHTQQVDGDLASKITGKIYSSLTADTPLRVLTGGKIEEVEDAILNKVIPERLAFRQGILDNINSGSPTQAARDANQGALSMALNCIRDDVQVGTREFSDRLSMASSMVTGGHARTNVRGDYSGREDVDGFALSVSGRKNPDFLAQVTNIVSELSLAQEQAKLNLPGYLARDDDRDQAIADNVKQQFTQVIEGRISEIDKRDGMHVRMDGEVSAPVTRGMKRPTFGESPPAPSSSPGKLQSFFKGIASKLTGEKPIEPKPQQSVRFAGSAEFQEMPGVDQGAESPRAIRRAFRNSPDPSAKAYMKCSGAVEQGLAAASAALDRTAMDYEDMDRLGLPMNMGPEILSDDTSAVDVLSVLSSRDHGIGRGITALKSVRQELHPETLPSNLLKGPADQWAAQTARISQMAGQIESASFSAEVPGAFLQYGNAVNNPYSAVVNDHPGQDMDVRYWIDEGLSLAGALHDAQTRPQQGLEPLSADELGHLQARVDDFARGSGALNR